MESLMSEEGQRLHGMNGSFSQASTSQRANCCVSLWVGAELGPVERACMKSVLRQGHELALYCYRPPSGVPKGVEVRDAAGILPEDRIFLQRNGSITCFSDWFRYELLQRGLGTWVDTDIYLLKPLDRVAATLLGEEQPGVINNAVLRLPPDSPLLARLLAVFEERKTPPWLPWRPYIASRLRELVEGKADMSRLPWGAMGPMAITALAKEAGIGVQALPSDIFYPVPWTQAGWIIDPETSMESLTTARTVGVHLWNECIRGFKNAPAPKGTFLERLHREGAL